MIRMLFPHLHSAVKILRGALAAMSRLMKKPICSNIRESNSAFRLIASVPIRSNSLGRSTETMKKSLYNRGTYHVFHQRVAYMNPAHPSRIKFFSSPTFSHARVRFLLSALSFYIFCRHVIIGGATVKVLSLVKLFRSALTRGTPLHPLDH